LPALRVDLSTRCPELTCLVLDGHHFLFVWWKTSWVWEAAAYNSGACIRYYKVLTLTWMIYKMTRRS
jgi:hypothetical protein